MASSLIFIADISGFTRFVLDTEINHTRHIISELLETLVEANRLGMELAEIEGDAVLFYKYLEVPGLTDIINQVEEMFLSFHSHLAAYRQNRICHCGACSTAHELTLKFVVHQGEFNFLRVKDHRKPHGSDVVLVHRLLKNDVPGKEYALFTEAWNDELNSGPLKTQFPWFTQKSSSSAYSEIGEVSYSYTSMEALKNKVEVKPSVFPELTRDPIVVEGMVDLDSQTVFELVTNFDFRDQWSTEALSLEYEKDRVNRVGTRHVCVFAKENLEFETVTNDFGPGKLVYGERLGNYKFVREAINYFIIQDRGEQTWLRIESHVKPKSALIKLFSPFYSMIFRKTLNKVFNNIKLAARRLKSRKNGHRKPVRMIA